MKTARTAWTRFFFAIAVATVLAPRLSFADDPKEDQDPPHRWKRLSISFSPQYYGLNTSGYSGAFTGNGFAAPKTSNIGFELTFYFTTESQWQLGFGWGDVGFSNDTGATNTAEYDQGYFGLWVAKNFQLSEVTDLSLGTLIGTGDAHTEVLSTTANGRTEEETMLLEPKLTITFKVAHWLKIGASVGYMEPLVPSDSVKGQNITPGNISVHGAKGGIEFVFGRFGNNPAEHEKPSDHLPNESENVNPAI